MRESSHSCVHDHVYVILCTCCTGSNIKDVALIGTESTLCDRCPELRVSIVQHSSELSKLTRSKRRYVLCGLTARNLTVWSLTFRSIYPAG